MDYTEDKAKEIAEKYNIPPATLVTWKHRGKIPKKYANPDYTPPAKLTKGDEAQLERLLKIFSLNKINRAEFGKRCDIDMTDILRKKTKPTAAQLKTMIHELRKLRNATRAITAEMKPGAFDAAVHAFLNDSVYVKNVIFDRDDEIRVRIDYFKRVKQDIPADLKTKLLDKLFVFNLETDL